jgi:hypothetical protein
VHPRAGDTHGDGEDTDCDGIDCEAGYSDDGIYFTICTEETTQAEAHARCIDAGYDGLTVIHNAEQQTTVTALAEAISSSDDKELWLGITDAEEEGLWTDRTGLIPYTNWWPGQPAGATRENCAISPAYASYEWHDVACSRTHWISCSATVSFESAVSLTCSIDEESTDADGDPVTYDFAWDVDGESYTDTETTIWDDDTIPSDALGDDETWTCTVTPDDGEDNGDPGSDSYYIEDDGCWEASYDGSTYTFCTEPLTRVAAEADCADRDMDLVKITSDGENDFVYTQSVDVGDWGHPGPWIGLQDEDLDGTFEWNDGLAMTYTDWCPSHPISPGSRAYVHMEIASSDYPCWAANGSSSSAELQYVCEETIEDGDGDGYTADEDCDDDDPSVHPYAGDTYGDGIDGDCDGMDCEATSDGATYFALCGPAQWEEASASCSAAGYDFGSVRSTPENDFISDLMLGSSLYFWPESLVGDAVWLGFSDRDDEGVWLWEDGYTGSYTNWAPGEPNDSGGQDCAYVDVNPSGRDGEWDDSACGEHGGERAFLCTAR